MSELSKADRLFNTWCEAKGIECELFDILSDRLGADAFDAVSHDYYDRSIELLGCRPGLVLDSDTLTLIHNWGFSHGWLNHTDGTETIFGADGIGEPRPAVRPRISSKEQQNVKRAIDSLLGLLREMAARYADHSGSCCTFAPDRKTVVVTPESCKCSALLRRVHNELGAYGTVAEIDAVLRGGRPR